MSAMMPRTEDFGASFLQGLIDVDIALAKHIGVVVESVDDHTLVLRAPLEPNANHKGTAFGGSLYSLAALAGWGWTTRYLAIRGISVEVVIQESNMRFLQPVHGELRAHLLAPGAADIDKLRKMLERAGRGRIQLRVELRNGTAVAALFEGLFAAAMRPRSG
jgi:thioesterase domain-containing protein